MFQDLPAIDSSPGVIFQTDQSDSVLNQHIGLSFLLFKHALASVFLGETSEQSSFS